MSDAQLLACDVIELTDRVERLAHENSIHREALYEALTLVNRAMLRIIDQDRQIRELMDLR